MIMTSALKRICDISFYMTFATILAWMFSGGNETGLALTLPIFIITAFVAAYLTKWDSARYLAVLPLMTVFIVAPRVTINLLVLIPAVFFMIYNLPRPNERGSKIEHQQLFNLFIRIFVFAMIIFVLLAFITTTSGAHSNVRFVEAIDFSNEVLVFAISFILNSIVYMRMIRHDYSILRQTRFKIMNSIPLIGVAGAAIIISNEHFLRTVMFIIGLPFYLIWNFIIIRTMPWLAHLISLPFRGIEFDNDMPPEVIDDELPSGKHCLRDDYGRLIRDEYGRPICEYPEIHEWIQPEVNNFLLILVIIAMIVGMVVLYKILLKYKTTPVSTEAGLIEERIALVEDNKRKFGRRRHENQIRAWYQRFLKLLKQNNFPTPTSATSLEIEKIAATKANPKHLSSFRNIYTRVRYGETDFSKDDVTNAKELYRQIKDEIES